MKQKKTYIKRFYEPIFKHELILVLGGEIDDVPILLKQKFKIYGSGKWINIESKFAGVTIFQDDGSCVIYFVSKDPDASSIVHEITHMVIKYAFFDN